jgi:hypothetical protein
MVALVYGMIGGEDTDFRGKRKAAKPQASLRTHACGFAVLE